MNSGTTTRAAAVLLALGAGAADSVTETLRISPAATVAEIRELYLNTVDWDSDPERIAWLTEATARYCDCLRKAGLPDE